MATCSPSEERWRTPGHAPSGLIELRDQLDLPSYAGVLRTGLMSVFSGRCRSCLAQKRLLRAQYLLEAHNLA